jgi:hypothetical protein
LASGARHLLIGTTLVALGGCGPSSSEGERLGVAVSESAVPGPWVIPDDTLAVGDTQWVEYTGAGPWVGEDGCSGGITPGAEIVRQYLAQYFPQATSIGGYSCRSIVGDETMMSVHGTGRALDVMIPLDGGEADNGLGDPVGNFLVENAEAIGIQYIIWDLWTWRGDRPAGAKDDSYGGLNPHADHLHIELSVEASEHTEMWFDTLVTPPDIEGCDPIPPEGAIVDDSSPCFQAFGPAQYWRLEQGVGYGDGLRWTNAFESDSPSNWGRWNLSFVEAGRYRVELYLEPAFAVAEEVRYHVVASGLANELFVDQSAAEGWTVLGTYDFAEGGEQSVDGFDDMPVPVAEDQHIAFDAVRLTREGLEPPDDPADAGPDDPADAGPDDPPVGGAGPATDNPSAGVSGETDGGCVATGRGLGPRAGAWAGAALLLVAATRARRRRRVAA